MAKFEMAAPFTHVRGRIGPLTYRKTDYGNVLAPFAASTTAPTAAQLQVREQFRAASAYAKRMLADPEQGPRYALAAAAKGMKPRPFAIADFFNEPVVQTIDVSGYHGTLGDLIKVQAFDDFEVTGVHIAVLDGENAVIFQGAAVLTNGLWQLAATVGIAIGETVTITATATDRPGHTGALSLVHTIA
jgi:hypothetical protein